jgi:O-antigen/teichoic acid export membrane protein
LTFSVLIPWLWSGRRLWDRSVHGWQRWTPWDLKYCGKFVTASLFAYQLGGIDILIAGVLFPSETVADYALAARIAALYSLFQLALLKRFAPRAARLIEMKDASALHQEFALCRKLIIGCGALTIAGILCIAPWLLPLFGNYSGAWTFLAWLAIPTFIQSFYDTSDRLLVIAGQANVPLAINAGSFAVLAVTPFVTAPWIGPIAMPAAMVASKLLFNPLVATRVKAIFAIRTIQGRDILMLAGGISALSAYAFTATVMAGVTSVTLLAAIAIYCGASAARRDRRVIVPSGERVEM